MALYGIGIDIMDVARMEKRLEADPGLAEDIFTPDEIAYCTSKRFPALHFAARFAAKEAFMKALGRGLQDGLMFSDIEIINDVHGRPKPRLHGAAEREAMRAGINNIQISLSHVKELATALVVLETKGLKSI